MEVKTHGLTKYVPVIVVSRNFFIGSYKRLNHSLAIYFHTSHFSIWIFGIKTMPLLRSMKIRNGLVFTARHRVNSFLQRIWVTESQCLSKFMLTVRANYLHDNRNNPKVFHSHSEFGQFHQRVFRFTES